MLIDCHTHSYSKHEISELLRTMKENKIDKSVIMYWPWPDFGRHKVPPIGEVLSNIKDFPNIFLAGSMVFADEDNYEGQLGVLGDFLSKKKIVGVKICLGYEHMFANDPRFDDTYDLCTKYNYPVIFHTGDTWNEIDNAMVRFANPIYIDDVASRFPKLKILISHIGNPCWIKEAAEVLYKNKNVYADFCGTLSFGGKFSKLYNDELKKQILWLVSYCESPRKLLFGTDYYVHEQKHYIDFLLNFTDFSAEDMEYIKRKNAENLFNL